jgi:hypothetical protein
MYVYTYVYIFRACTHQFASTCTHMCVCMCMYKWVLYSYIKHIDVHQLICFNVLTRLVFFGQRNWDWAEAWLLLFILGTGVVLIIYTGRRRGLVTETGRRRGYQYALQQIDRRNLSFYRASCQFESGEMIARTYCCRAFRQLWEGLLGKMPYSKKSMLSLTQRSTRRESSVARKVCLCACMPLSDINV